jgi:hypothetical protein
VSTEIISPARRDPRPKAKQVPFSYDRVIVTANQPSLATNRFDLKTCDAVPAAVRRHQPLRHRSAVHTCRRRGSKQARPRRRRHDGTQDDAATAPPTRGDALCSTHRPRRQGLSFLPSSMVSTAGQSSQWSAPSWHMYDERTRVGPAWPRLAVVWLAQPRPRVPSRSAMHLPGRRPHTHTRWPHRSPAAQSRHRDTITPTIPRVGTSPLRASQTQFSIPPDHTRWPRTTTACPYIGGATTSTMMQG